MSVHPHRCPHCFRHWICRESICIAGGNVGFISLVSTLACDSEACALAEARTHHDRAYQTELERRSGCYDEGGE